MFSRGGEFLRQVNEGAFDDLAVLTQSGLYDDLVHAGLLIPHEVADLSLAASSEAKAVIRPEQIPLISYPYEWCFSELKDAALATLDIQRRALAKGMCLKDASAFNIQFLRGGPALIDTLSLERYREGEPWVAYRQFCRHFLGPLALMSLVDVRLASLLRSSIDGIPLDLAARLLPRKTRWNPGLLMHIHLHGKVESQRAEAQKSGPQPSLPKTGLLGLVDSLEKAIRNLSWEPKGTQWADYYEDNNYSPVAMEDKRRIVKSMLEQMSPNPQMLWDLGGNTGEFSQIAASAGIETICWDIDDGAVELAYRRVRKEGIKNMTPLRQDLMNPSPNLGWAESERDSLTKRGPADALFALALVHHLAIANNVPLPNIACFLARTARWAVIEWIPKEDSQVQRLLASRKDVFPNYNQKSFETALRKEFEIVQQAPIRDGLRTLYLVRRSL